MEARERLEHGRGWVFGRVFQTLASVKMRKDAVAASSPRKETLGHFLLMLQVEKKIP